MVRENIRARRARIRISQKKKHQWTAREKLMIIAYYEQGHSKRETANKFEIESKQLRDWLQNKDKLMKVAPYIQKLTPGLRLKYPELETELLDWFKKSRSQLKVITRYMIQAKTHSFANRTVYQDMYTNINTAKFS